MTNNDKLNAMTAEEKAVLINEQYWCCVCECCDLSLYKGDRPICENTDCKPAILKWLNNETD